MLITIRHGKTDYNEKRLFSGIGDEPRLTKESLLKAYDLGKELLNYNLDVAFVSPLTRAKQTFSEINKSLGIEMIEDSHFIERNFKEYEKTSIDLLDPQIYWNMEKDSLYDMESLEDLISRVEEGLRIIKHKYSDKNVLIVAHSGICRAIKYILEGKVNPKWYEYDMANLKVYAYKNWKIK